MGRQIGFFFDRKDEEAFIDHALENGCLILDTRGSILHKPMIVGSDVKKNSQVLITMEGLNVEKYSEESEYVCSITSEVIEFSRCQSWYEKTLSDGRIWAEFKHWNSEGRLEKKSDRLDKLYKLLVKWIKNNARLSVDKEYYIGEHAYKLYSEADWTMSAASNTIRPVEFEFEIEHSGQIQVLDEAKQETAIDESWKAFHCEGSEGLDGSEGFVRFLKDYTDGEIDKTVLARCNQCGAIGFSFKIDAEEGAIETRCARCGKKRLILDSEEYWDDCEPKNTKCPECNKNKFNISIGFVYMETGDVKHVKWVYVGARCVKCGAMTVFGDWEINYSPTIDMERNV